MWPLVVLFLLITAAPAFVEPGFSERYGRNTDIVAVMNSVGYCGDPAYD